MELADREMEKYLKTGLTIFICCQAIAIFGISLKNIVIPNPTSTPAPPEFLKPSNLDAWQSQEIQSLSINDFDDSIPGNFLTGYQLSASQTASSLVIKEGIFSNSNGDLKGYLRQQNQDLQSISYHDNNLGYYSQYQVGDRLVMTACITHSGKTTITADQFKVAQIKATFDVSQIWNWLANNQNLVPNICHWRSLSIEPVTADTSETLINIWQTLNEQ